MSNKNNQIIAGIVAVLAIIAIWWLATNRDNFEAGANATTNTGGSLSTSENTATTGSAGTQTGASTSGTASTLSSPTTSASGESVIVSNQAAGSAVVLGAVTVTKSSWVVVRDSKGWILGAARFDASAPSGTVPLLRATTAGETYAVVFYADDGDRMFDMKKDMMVSGEGSASVTFAAQ